MEKSQKLEKVLWSIALPGFGQLLNKNYVKGITLIVLEVVINLQSHLNKAIQYSFHGKITEAISETNYQWLMFYPCVYMFAIWDAYRDAAEDRAPYSYLPFVTAAFFATVGMIYSPTMKIFGYSLGPVWLTMLFCFIGLAFGMLIKKVISD